MERWKRLDRFPKILIMLVVGMAILFAVIYANVIGRVGYLYQDKILVPETVDGTTTYTGRVRSRTAVFTVTADKVVTYRWDNLIYGPYTVVEDATAIPEDVDIQDMTGVEIRRGEEIFFRGGVYQSPDSLWIF